MSQVDPSPEIVTDEQMDLLMQDPLIFYVIQQVTVGNIRSITRLREHFSFRRDVSHRLIPTLEKMRQAGWISIEADSITVHKNRFRFRPSRRSQARLIPALFEIAANRALSGVEQGVQGPIMFMVSDDPVTESEIKEAIEEFRTKMRSIGERVKTRKPQGTRIVGLVNAPMIGQDYAPVDLTEQSVYESPNLARRRLAEIRKAAHDIKPALAAFKAFRDSVRSSVEPGSLALASAALDRVEKVAQDFLNPADRKVKDDSASIMQTIDRILSEKRQYWADDIDLEVDLPIGEFRCTIAEAAFERILSNLLENSYKALTSDTKRIRLRAVYETNQAKLLIEDSGCGIRPGLLTDINNRNYRSETPGGYGLGLRQTIEAVENSGGTVTITSDGAGTAVELVLPGKPSPA